MTKQKKNPKQKIICSALAETIVVLCLAAVPVSAERVLTNNMSYSTYDINKDGKVNVFDNSYMRNFLIGGSYVTATEANNNQAVVNARYAVEQYIKEISGTLLANIRNVTVTGFTDPETGEIEDDCLATITFRRALSKDELTSICKCNDRAAFDSILLSESISKQTECNCLRVLVKHQSVKAVIPSSSAAINMSKTNISKKPSYLTYDIDGNRKVDTSDLTYLRDFLIGRSTITPEEQHNKYAVENAVNIVKKYISNYKSALVTNINDNSIYVDALMTTTGKIDSDFLITVPFNLRTLDLVTICELCTDDTWLGSPYVGNIMENIDNYFCLTFSVINGQVDTVIPTNFKELMYALSSDYIAKPYADDLDLNSTEKAVISDINQGVRKAVLDKSEILYAKIVDIDNEPDGNGYSLDHIATTVTFDSPLSSDEICILTDLDTDTDYSAYYDKTTKARAYESGGSYKLVPILDE